jgi:hypothetical protein
VQGTPCAPVLEIIRSRRTLHVNAIKPVPTQGGIKQLYTLWDSVVSGNPRSEMTETTDNLTGF